MKALNLLNYALDDWHQGSGNLAAGRSPFLARDLGMAACAEGAVHGELTRRWPQALEHFIHHDGQMRSGRRLPRRHDLFDIGCVSLGIELLVLFVKRARMLAGVSRAALVVGRHGVPVVPAEGCGADAGERTICSVPTGCALNSVGTCVISRPSSMTCGTYDAAGLDGSSTCSSVCPTGGSC